MSVIHFWTTAKGGFPHLSYIFCKPEPLGTEFNTVKNFVTGSFLSIVIHRVKGGGE